MKTETAVEELERRIQYVKDMGFECIKTGVYKEPVSEIEITDSILIAWDEATFVSEMEFIDYILGK